MQLVISALFLYRGCDLLLAGGQKGGSRINIFWMVAGVMVRWQTVIWSGGGGGLDDCASDFHFEVSSKCYFCRLLLNIRPIANINKSVHASLYVK